MGHFATSLINCSCQGSLPLYGTFYWKWNIFDIALNFNSYFILTYYLWFSKPFLMIVYKKTDEWYIEWQRVTTNNNECYNEWKNDSEWYNEWQQMTTNSNERERVTAVVQWTKTTQYTSKNGSLPSFQWQKQIHYYFKGWMAALRVVK